MLEDIARDVLRLDDEARQHLLAEFVAETGARFVASSWPIPTAQRWREAGEEDRRGYLESVGRRMFNARVHMPEANERSLAVDVTACRFVELCKLAGRPHLAPLFCEADARHFDSARAIVTLRRSGTIARGAARCDFRFEYR